MPGATVLELSGRLDGVASPGFESRVEALIAANTRQIVFDCSRLTYASSAGLRVFLSSAKRLKAAGGRALITSLAPSVREVFALSGFLEVLTVLPTTADAAKALS